LRPHSNNKGIEMFNRVAISAAVVGLIVSMSVADASEVWVSQARGRISGGTTVAEENKPKAAPEGGTNPVAAGSPTTPVTCNQQNAASPACYSATQQAKGK
jgi:hypothetical protein